MLSLTYYYIAHFTGKSRRVELVFRVQNQRCVQCALVQLLGRLACQQVEHMGGDHPKSYLGVDRNRKAIEFCRKSYSIEELSFDQGDAEALQFDDQSFDVIINVEASHCYGDMAQFVREVARLLRPGGYFLYADFRSTAEQEALRWFRQAIDDRALVDSTALSHLKANHWRDPLLDSAAFQQLREPVGAL